MAKIRNTKGEMIDANITVEMYATANKQNLSLPAYLNRLYAHETDVQKYGSPFQQVCVSEGVYVPKLNGEQLRAATIEDILSGAAALSYDAATVQQRGGDYGLQSRILFPVAVIDLIESTLAKDLTTDLTLFNGMVAQNLGVASDTYEQPIINYQTQNGPDGTNRAQAQRIGQLQLPAVMAIFTTSQNPYRLPTYSIGAEFSKEALKATTLDLVALSLSRFFSVEADGRVYDYMSKLWNGNPDIGATTAISAVTSTSLDSAATGGVLTHKAWVKFLYRNRKYRRISHVVCDLDTYFQIEGRTGRPGAIGILDPTLPTIDPQATAMNPYVGNVQVFLVDPATAGGPVPASTVWALDKRYGIVKVSNTAAAYQAAQDFALKKSEAFRIDWSEDVYRLYDQAFDVLTVS